VSIGEPVADLDQWAAEVAMWLDEAFATADLRYVRRETDPVAGHTVVTFAPYINPDVVRELLEIAGIGVDLVSVPPHVTGALIGVVADGARRWRVFSADQEAAVYENELYAWGDLYERIYRRWPKEIDAAEDVWNGPA
jgi:hypothetical protein